MGKKHGQRLPNNLEPLRKERKLKQHEMAEIMGITVSAYRKIIVGDRGLDLQYVQKLSKALKVSHGDITEPKLAIPIVGYVAAGSTAIVAEEGQGPFGEAPRIAEATPSTVAVEIRGTSLGSIFDGWLAYYDDLRTPPTMDLVGWVCVVGLDDGRVLIKKIARARGHHHFDLWSNAEEPMFEVLIKWAARVITMRPR